MSPSARFCFLFCLIALVSLGSAAPPRDFDDIEEHDALYKRGWPVRYVTGGGVMEIKRGDSKHLFDALMGLKRSREWMLHRQ
uniref:Secreted protein n=2 Tax=Macrostomum lignano TaxID=282301 RepID=A0A1I8JHN8_9PLAT